MRVGRGKVREDVCVLKARVRVKVKKGRVTKIPATRQGGPGVTEAGRAGSDRGREACA